MSLVRRLLAGAVLAAPAALAAQQGTQPIDSAYTARIRELTPTDARWKFSTELVDYLPASATVPTPLKILGYVPGTIARLSKTDEVNRYFRALDDASPRVKVFSLGKSDEGREMIIAAIADSSVLANLETNRQNLHRLSDPRALSTDERARLVRETVPMYWLTGGLHSPETGSPEMLMELAYRLAVDEGPNTKAIRAGVITLITPILEVDGRDRVVDAIKLSRALKLGPSSVPLVYWGRYTAHDNNRDGMVASQKLTQNFLNGFLHWRPIATHDLHESVPFLYTSTGTGPYNDEFDPIVINEWHQLAYQEINELTKRGLPGVWTHGFYDGWAPNYLLAITNLHNSIGRFYETYTSMGADCHTVKLPASSTERRWDRPNPPVNGVKWCIRSNINYQQSGVLVALRYVADNAQLLLNNFVAKSDRMVQRGRTSAPYAYVIPKDQHRPAEAADLVNLFRTHGAEVHVATAEFEVKREAASGKWEAKQNADSARGAGVAADSTPKDSASRSPLPASRVVVHPGDWIVRMDQPYAAPVRTLLAVQKYKADDPPPYDDTGWTLDELRHVTTYAISDSSVLSKPMTLLQGEATVESTVAGTGGTLIVPHLGDWRSAMLPWKVAPARVSVATASFTAAGTSYPAGTFIVEDAKGGKAREAVAALGLDGTAVAEKPSVATRALALPRIALMHSWIETQNEGWVRYAFDAMGVPYTSISDQSLRRPGTLDRFDVVVFPHVSAFGNTSLLNGRPMTGPAIPWKKTELTPSLGRGPLNVLDETDDVRPGMGLEGAAALRRFVERGGVLIATGNSARLPVELDFNPGVSIAETRALRTRGAIFRAQTVETKSPILYGYERSTFPVYFDRGPLFTVQGPDTTGRLDLVDPAIVAEMDRMRGRVILKFHKSADSLLVSGLLVGGTDLAGKPAIVDAPLGKGHVLLFSIRPFWRWETQGSFALALNAMANWNALDAPVEEKGRSVAAGGQ